MRTPFPPDVRSLGPNLDEVFERAVEGAYKHTAVEHATADVSVACAAANTFYTTVITFEKEFAAAPVVIVWLVGVPTAAYVTVAATSILTTGFTLKVASGSIQTVDVRWLAYGRRE